MYFKLAKRNMHRSMKEYAVYFITLIFSIALFYTFNSINDQKVLLNLDSNWENAFKTITIFMGIASVFVVFILAFLILYSNNYLIRRRKKELGIYLTLGMENGGVAKILFFETFILGAVSLALGLILGVFVSQILSIFTANLFEIEMISFTFVFSKDACIKTILAFGGIYLLVGIFNILSIRKIKLINLINANKKNESIKIKNPILSFIIFIISNGIIAAAYYIVLGNGVAVLDRKTILAIVLGIIGTFLFFMSLSGFLLTLLKKSDNIYLKNLNMFLIRQLNSKINTAFISMSFICLMLFLAICMLSSGLSLNKVMNKNVADLTPYDMTLYSYTAADIPEVLEENKVNLKDYTDSYHYMATYISHLRYSHILSEETMNKGKVFYPINQNTNIEFMKISDLNKELKNLGKEEIDLKKDEFVIVSDVSDIFNDEGKICDDDKVIEVNGKEYKSADRPVVELTFFNGVIKGTLGIVAIEDSAVENMKPLNSYLNLNFRTNIGNCEKDLAAIFNNVNSDKSYFYYLSKNDVINSAKGTGAAISFLGIYLGIIFIIASSALLAIQQLSSIDDNISRYNLLKKIGVEESSINKSVKSEIGIYFGMPLFLAVIHSIVGLKLANDIIGVFGSGSSILKLMIVSAAFIIIIYGTYYIGTYICAKSIIGKNIKVY